MFSQSSANISRPWACPVKTCVQNSFLTYRIRDVSRVVLHGVDDGINHLLKHLRGNSKECCSKKPRLALTEKRRELFHTGESVFIDSPNEIEKLYPMIRKACVIFQQHHQGTLWQWMSADFPLISYQAEITHLEHMGHYSWNIIKYSLLQLADDSCHQNKHIRISCLWDVLLCNSQVSGQGLHCQEGLPDNLPEQPRKVLARTRFVEY